MIALRRLVHRATPDFDATARALLAFEGAQDEAGRARGRRNPGRGAQRAAMRRCSSTRAASIGVEADSLAELELPRAATRGGAGRAAARRSATRLQQAAARVRDLPRTPARRTRGRYTEADGTRLGQKVDAARPRRPVRAGRQGRLSRLGADERDSGQGGRRGRADHGGADAARRQESPGAGGRRDRRRRPRVHHRRRAGGRRAGLSARETIPQVDKIVGPGNAYVAAAKRRVFGVVGIDMVAGPSEMLIISDGVDQPRLGGDGSVLPGRARRAGAVDSAQPRCHVHRRGGGEHRAAVAADAAARGHPGFAGRARRADRDARSGGGVRDRQPHRARASGTGASTMPNAGSTASAMPARSSSATTLRSRWATTAPARITCCRPRAARAFPRRWGSTISRSAPASSRCRAPVPTASAASRPFSPTARGSRPTPAPPSCGSRRSKPRYSLIQLISRAVLRPTTVCSRLAGISDALAERGVLPPMISASCCG